MAKVPVISLSQPENEVIDAVRDASTSTGFFVLREHGIRKQLLDDALANCKALFSLPEDKKISLKSDVLFTGYQPFGGISVDPQSEVQDRREGFYACKGAPWIPKSDPDSWPAGQWPPQDLLPGFAATADEFCREALQLSRRISRLLSKALGQPEAWLDGFLQDPFVALHNLHYAPVPSQPEKGILGLGAHSDFGLLTLLLAREPGLQILVDDEWQDLTAGDDAIIVNLGDELAKRLTIDTFKSQVHRVVSHGLDRYSVAYFVNADFDSTLECLPSCCREALAKYPPIKSSDFMTEKFSAAHKSS